MTWLGQEWHKIAIGIVAIGKGIEWCYKLYEKFDTAKEFIERRYHERRHTMLNPLQLLSDLQKVSSAITKLQSGLPFVLKMAEDYKAIVASKDNPAGEIEAIDTFIKDFQEALTEMRLVVPEDPAKPV